MIHFVLCGFLFFTGNIDFFQMSKSYFFCLTENKFLFCIFFAYIVITLIVHTCYILCHI